MKYGRLCRVLFVAVVGLFVGVIGTEQAASAQVLPLPGARSGVADAQGAHPDPRLQGGSRGRRRRVTRRGRGRANAPRGAAGGQVTVPVDVGVGPAFFAFGNPSLDKGSLTGPVYDDQPFHYGLRLGVAAVIDYEFVRKHSRLVPAKYRGMFKPGSEVKITPGALALIPRDIIISPKTNHTGVFGATWELLHVGMNLLGSGHTHLSVGAGLLATYAYIYSDAFASPTHFLRPGVCAGIKFSTMFSDTVGLSAGWDSNFYIPQDIGGGIFQSGTGDNALWHIGEAFVMLHVRFPYTTSL